MLFRIRWCESPVSKGKYYQAIQLVKLPEQAMRNDIIHPSLPTSRNSALKVHYTSLQAITILTHGGKHIYSTKVLYLQFVQFQDPLLLIFWKNLIYKLTVCHIATRSGLVDRIFSNDLWNEKRAWMDILSNTFTLKQQSISFSTLWYRK